MRRALLAFALALSALGGAWAQSLSILSPEAASSTTPRAFVNVLGRTSVGSVVRIGGEQVPVYSTGVFVRDRVPLTLGVNVIEIEATSAQGEVSRSRIDVERIAPPPPPPPLPSDRLVIDEKSVLPQATRLVSEDEAVDVLFTATAGQRAEAKLAGQAWQMLDEHKPGQYSGRLFFNGQTDIAAAPVQLRLSVPRGVRWRGPRSLLAATLGPAGLWHSRSRHLFITGSEGANLTHGVHDVRLGGPNLTELPPGVMLRATGQQGGSYRVALSADTDAWVATESVSIAPAGTRAPAGIVTSASVAGSAEGDSVSLAWPAALPYALRAVAASDGRQHLELDLFGSHHANTWITHRATAKVVRDVSAEQRANGHVRVSISTHSGRLWGWRVDRDGGALRIHVRAAPKVGSTPSVLTGMLIALEPGHGSSANLGAVGATRVPEKDINRWTVEALKAELESVGARVVVVRDGDDNPTVRERARRVTDSGAALFVSVHANSTDTGNGYLRAAGASMFYKHAHGRDLAVTVQRRLLEETGLPDFGRVGNFNYAPTRLVTWAPAVLVEQAFMSNPAEEAQLLDPVFRARIARAVRLGLEDFLTSATRAP